MFSPSMHRLSQKHDAPHKDVTRHNHQRIDDARHLTSPVFSRLTLAGAVPMVFDVSGLGLPDTRAA